MKTGIKLIAQEREEQIKKHKRTIEYDKAQNAPNILAEAAAVLLFTNDFGRIVAQNDCPRGWDPNIWRYMVRSSFEKRVIIAGALCAAQIDVIHAMAEEEFKEAPAF